MKKLIIFDMDGTINDSSPGITYCFRKTCEHYGKTDVSDELLRTRLCGPFMDNLKSIVGINDSQIPEAVDFYVKHYASEGQAMARLFPDISDVIRTLKDSGYRLAIATLMAEKYAVMTLKKESIYDLFETVHGASFEVEYTKRDLLEQCLDSTGVSVRDTIMIGDGVDDYLSAKGMGMDFIAAGYGYELDPGFCEEHGLRYVRDPKGLLDVL